MTAVTIGSNIASLDAQRQLGQESSAVNDIYEQLSSGSRINKASDDAAGLAVASSLTAIQRVYTQGVRNLNDGTSLLNIADAAVGELSNIATRLKELAEQSANGTYGVKQRQSLDAEAQALSKEYTRIIQSTKFNGQQVLSGNFGQLQIQAGFGVTGGIQSGLGGAVGTGSFNTSGTYAASVITFTSVALGDINGDGILDLVTGGGGSGGQAMVQLGNGDGTFAAAISYAAESSQTVAVSLGDLNSDGILDLVTAGMGLDGQGHATVRLGNGDGTFGAAVSYLTESGGSTSLKLGDLNGDGILDLVTQGQDGTGSGWATARLGNGNGGFGAAVSYATEPISTSGITLGDLNGDGILDLVTTGYSSPDGGVATVRLGKGDGTFGAAVSYTEEPLNSLAPALGDLNGDGILDLVTAGDGPSSQGQATVRLGKGDGAFGPSRSYATETGQSVALSLADLNGDGVLDLVTAGEVHSGAPLGGATTVRLGKGDGSFAAALSYSTNSGFTFGLALGDLNGDGVLDIATTGFQFPSSNGSSTILLAGTSSGASPLLPFTLTSRAGALQALSQFTTALNNISSQRGVIGAFESRINVAVNVLQVSSENFRAAASRITDADVASESASLVSSQILEQASTAVLAQANQQPALALQLLGNA